MEENKNEKTPKENLVEQDLAEHGAKSVDLIQEKREPIKYDMENGPWKDPILETDSYYAFLDKFPVSEGHALFVPKDDTFECLAQSFVAAYASGVNSSGPEGFAGFNIGMNVGKAAGQTVDWPHVHLIPRREGDVEDPTGGVRNVIPGKGNYKENK